MTSAFGIGAPRSSTTVPNTSRSRSAALRSRSTSGSSGGVGAFAATVAARVVGVVRDGAVVWHHNDRAHLDMRDLSDSFIEWYINRTGDQICDSVGAYKLEGLGAQLFSNIEGDFFSILGLLSN